MIKELSPKEAKARGYKPLAGPYDLATSHSSVRWRETQFWRNVCRDMATCDAVAVDIGEGQMEVWRHERELLTDTASYETRTT